MMKNSWILLLIIAAFFTACDHTIQTGEAKAATVLPNTNGGGSSPGIFANSSNSLDPYWYQGLAELNVYELEQNRYQGIHPGEVLFIFVTEDFLVDKQVKNDSYQNKNSTQVLKTNAISRFTTGLYDYSMMTSVFTPVKTTDHSRTLKVTNSSQDWCGQSLSQLNLVGDDYRNRLFSYFEKEGDQDETAAADMLEDEVWARVRQFGAKLPTGEFNIIPSMNFLRLLHKPYKAYQAKTTIADYTGDVFTGEQLKVYTITYPEFNRELKVVFEAKSPFKIVGWQDIYPSMFDGQLRTSTARLKKTILEKYWSKNSSSVANASAREKLGW